MWDSWQTKWHFSRFLRFSSASHHSTIAPYPSITTPWGVRQPWSGSTLSHPRSSSWGLHLWAGPRGMKRSLNQKLSVSNSGTKKPTKESAKRQHRWADKRDWREANNEQTIFLQKWHKWPRRPTEIMTRYPSPLSRTQERRTENRREGVERRIKGGRGHAYWSHPAWGTGITSNETRNAGASADDMTLQNSSSQRHCYELWLSGKD
jgi:hypothetical protein